MPTTKPPTEGVVTKKDKADVEVTVSPEIKTKALQNLIGALDVFDIPQEDVLPALADKSATLRSAMEPLPEAYAGMFTEADKLSSDLQGVDIQGLPSGVKERATALAESDLGNPGKNDKY